MAVAEHTYSYLTPSSVAIEYGRSELTLATSGGPAAHPYFFTVQRWNGSEVRCRARRSSGATVQSLLALTPHAAAQA
jgi:hypothetical protein